MYFVEDHLNPGTFLDVDTRSLILDFNTSPASIISLPFKQDLPFGWDKKQMYAIRVEPDGSLQLKDALLFADLKDAMEAWKTGKGKPAPGSAEFFTVGEGAQASVGLMPSLSQDIWGMPRWLFIIVLVLLGIVAFRTYRKLTE